MLFVVEEWVINSHFAAVRMPCKAWNEYKNEMWLLEFYCKKYGDNILGYTILSDIYS